MGRHNPYRHDFHGLILETVENEWLGTTPARLYKALSVFIEPAWLRLHLPLAVAQLVAAGHLHHGRDLDCHSWGNNFLSLTRPDPSGWSHTNTVFSATHTFYCGHVQIDETDGRPAPIKTVPPSHHPRD